MRTSSARRFVGIHTTSDQDDVLQEAVTLLDKADDLRGSVRGLLCGLDDALAEADRLEKELAAVRRELANANTMLEDAREQLSEAEARADELEAELAELR